MMNYFNAGWHGDYYSKWTTKLFTDRYNLHKHAADELGLPFYMVDSNLHAFMWSVYRNPIGRMGYFANYSCAFALGRVLKKYYMSNCISYKQLLMFGTRYRNGDFAEFSEGYSVPLIQTEKTELVIDGCQYERHDKIQKLAD